MVVVGSTNTRAFVTAASPDQRQRPCTPAAAAGVPERGAAAAAGGAGQRGGEGSQAGAAAGHRPQRPGGGSWGGIGAIAPDFDGLLGECLISEVSGY